jgi:phosphopantothenoylcysteine decarboxylase/phosphopantothenate--cysteine ligase
MLEKKTILLGVTGGIAAYKAATLASRLTQAGANVIVIMTHYAKEFVGPITFESLTQNPVAHEMFPREGNIRVHRSFTPGTDDWQIGTRHISLADSADLLVIAPATANMIGKIANGIADDLLSTVVMAVNCPVLIAPAMNVKMIENRIVKDNIQKLSDLGYRFIEGESGRLACGYEGKGRMAEPEDILAAISDVLEQGSEMLGLKVLVTAGPTAEAIDEVRFISNRSSGRMGYSVAESALDRGAQVTLITGPTSIPLPPGAEVLRVESAAEMEQAVFDRFPECDILVMAAAVADFQMPHPYSGKVRRSEALHLDLVPTRDILKEVKLRKKPYQKVVGFALETEDGEENARRKLEEKGVDMVVLNNPLIPGAEFGSDTNIATILTPKGDPIRLEKMPKRELADRIFDELMQP